MVVDRPFQRGHAVPERLGHLLQVRHVERHARRLHPPEDARERELHLGQQGLEAGARDPLGHGGREEPDRRGLGPHARRGVGEELAGVLGLVLREVKAEVALREHRERIVRLRGIQKIAREHGVEGHAVQAVSFGEQGGLELLPVVDPLRCGAVGEPGGDDVGDGVGGSEDGLPAPGRDRQPAEPPVQERGDGERVRPGEQAGDLGRVAGPDLERRPFDLGLGGALDVLQPLQERAELERVEEPPDRLGIPFPDHTVRDVDGELEVGHEPRELLVAHEIPVRALDRLAKAALDLVRVGKQLLDAAELLHQPGGGFLPHAGHARDVVGGVALQRHVVEVALRREPEPLGHCRDVVGRDVGDPAPVEHHRDPGTNELEEVTIGRDDHGVDPLVERAQREGGDRVVGLVAFDLHDGDGQGLEHLVDQPELLLELVRRLRPAGLVVGVLSQPHRRAPLVEVHCQVVGALLSEELDEHRREPVDGVRDLAAAGGEGRREREEGPVRQAVSVQEEDPLRRLGVRRRAAIGGHHPGL